jgi:hypothetical protein
MRSQNHILIIKGNRNPRDSSSDSDSREFPSLKEERKSAKLPHLNNQGRLFSFDPNVMADSSQIDIEDENIMDSRITKKLNLHIFDETDKSSVESNACTDLLEHTFPEETNNWESSIHVKVAAHTEKTAKTPKSQLGDLIVS